MVPYISHPIFSFFLVQLHMVSENDFAVIIETRKPQFVYTSEPYDITDDNKAADIMTGSPLNPSTDSSDA